MIRMILSCATVTYSPSVPDIPVIHVWEHPPLIVVCPGVAGGYDRWELAARRTTRHGAKWHGIVPSACDGLPSAGEVWIVPLGDGAGVDANVAGLTLSHVRDGIASWAVTGVRDGAASTWTPEHELLHVQGLDHHTMTEHVMNRDLQGGGWGWDGVRRALREAWGR